MDTPGQSSEVLLFACAGGSNVGQMSNEAAIALYRAEAFTDVARRSEYYPPVVPGGAREDALIMRLAPAPAGDAHESAGS